MSDRGPLLARLERAEQRLETGILAIANERKVVAELGAAGLLYEEAVRRRAGYEQMHATNLAICQDIKKELAEVSCQLFPYGQ